MPVKESNVVERDILLMYKNSQSGVPLSYGNKSYKSGWAEGVEEQSADFLDDYISGKAIIRDEDLDVMQEYLQILRTSRNPRIVANIERAEKKYKMAVISRHRQEMMILQNQEAAKIEIKDNKDDSNSVLPDPEAVLPDPEAILMPKTDTHKRSIQEKEKTKKTKKTKQIKKAEPKESAGAIVMLASDFDKSVSLSKNQFAILQNKKKASQLSASDYLLIADLLKEEKGYSTKTATARLQSYAQLRINKVLAGQLPYEEDFDSLVSALGTYAQKENFRRRKDIIQGGEAIRKAMAKKQERPVVNKEDKPEKSEKKKVETSVKPVNKKSEKQVVFVHKTPWYKKILKAAAAVVAGAFVLFGFAKATNFFKSSSKDKASPKTEIFAKTNLASKTDAKAQTRDLNFQEIRQNINAKKAQMAAVASSATQEKAVAETPVSVSQETPKVQDQPENKNDSVWSDRVETFKKAQDKLNINLDNLDEVVNQQISAGNIVLSENLTEARAKYMISFYAQYPDTEAGKVCNALLNGETVQVSKDDFNKWNEELGPKGGKFINNLKKQGYTTTTFSPSDYVYYTTTTRDV